MNKGQNVRRGRAKTTSKRGGSSNAGNRTHNKSQGNPKQNLDKYTAMARDARQSGDRVNEEYYLQFADHFQRLINERNASAGEQNNNAQRGRNDNNRRGGNDQQSNNNNNNNHNASQGAVKKDPADQAQPKDVRPDTKNGTKNDANTDAAAEKPKARAPRRKKPVDASVNKPMADKSEAKADVKSEAKPKAKAEAKPETDEAA